MMTTVLLSGWNPGFEKVKFTLLLKDALGYPLAQAKKVTDIILDDGTVTLQVPEAEVDRLLSSMSALGAKCAAAVASR